MRFLWPDLLWLLLALPALVAAYLYALRRRKKSAVHYASLMLVRDAITRGQALRRHVPPLLFMLAMIAAVDRFQLQRGTATGSGLILSLAQLLPDAGIDLESAVFNNAFSRNGSNAAPLDRKQKADKKNLTPVAPGSYTSGAIILLSD